MIVRGNRVKTPRQCATGGKTAATVLGARTVHGARVLVHLSGFFLFHELPGHSPPLLFLIPLPLSFSLALPAGKSASAAARLRLRCREIFNTEEPAGRNEDKTKGKDRLRLQ